MIRQLGILLSAFALGTGIGVVFGAASFGIALGIGQLFFAVALVWILLT